MALHVLDRMHVARRNQSIHVPKLNGFTRVSDYTVHNMNAAANQTDLDTSIHGEAGQQFPIVDASQSRV